jgi:hypothetical protein
MATQTTGNRYFEAFSGLCLSAISRGIRSGPRELASASVAASVAAARLPSADLRKIPAVPLDELLGSRKPLVRLPVQAYEDGMLPSDQALVLSSLLVAEGPKVVLEIGTFMGHTAKLMAMNLPESMIHTVDLPLDYSPNSDPVANLTKDDFHLIAARRVGREFLGTEYQPRIRQHFGDTAVWDFRQAEGATFFFIDGAHSYDYCKSDSEKCLSLSKGRGVFLWHDCDDAHPGVLRMLCEWRALGRDVVRVEGTPLAYWKAE